MSPHKVTFPRHETSVFDGSVLLTEEVVKVLGPTYGFKGRGVKKVDIVNSIIIEEVKEYF